MKRGISKRPSMPRRTSSKQRPPMARRSSSNQRRYQATLASPRPPPPVPVLDAKSWTTVSTPSDSEEVVSDFTDDDAAHHSASDDRPPLHKTSSDASSTSSRPRTRRMNARIGAWREGVVIPAGIPNISEADQFLLQELETPPLPSSEQSTGSSSSPESRPPLAVIIPQSKFAGQIDAAQNDTSALGTVSTSKNDTLPSHKNTALASEDHTPLTAVPAWDDSRTPRGRPRGHIRDLSKSTVSSSTSRSSLDDDTSEYTPQSSRTSVDSDLNRPDAQTRKARAIFSIASPRAAGVFDEPLPPMPTLANLDKSLPPSPEAGRETMVLKKAKTLQRQKASPIMMPKRSPSTAPKPAQRPIDLLQGLKATAPTSCSSYKSVDLLDDLDDAFMKTNPSVASTSQKSSPTFSEVVSDLQKTLGEIPGSRNNSRQSDIITSPQIIISPSLTFEDAPTIPVKSSLRQLNENHQTDPIMLPSFSFAGRPRSMSDTSNLASGISPLGLPSATYSEATSELIECYLDVKRVSTLPIKLDVEANDAKTLPTLTTLSQAVYDPTKDNRSPLETLQAVSFAPHIAAALHSPSFPGSPQEPLSAHTARLSSLFPATALDNTTRVVDEPSAVMSTPRKHIMQSATPECENVLLQILSSTHSHKDLINISNTSHAMRRIYKKNELSLLRQVCRKQSLASWELREWAPPQRADSSTEDDIPPIEHTAETYLKGIHREGKILLKLKQLLLSRCQSSLRPETVSALSSERDPQAQRFDDAIYRLWCFCRIFGGDKGREEDITGQLDWLKGGLLAQQQDCAPTMNGISNIDLSSVLLNPPDQFGECNRGGLSADQLYDMTEIWNCLSLLLENYNGKISHARTYGVFDRINVKHGDVATEKLMLQEWISYVLSLGLDVVVKLAELADHVSAGFTLARSHGWTKWDPLDVYLGPGGFFNEPVARLYEERKIEAAHPATQRRSRIEKEEHSRMRTTQLAQQIRLARHANSPHRPSYIDMTNDCPLSPAVNGSSPPDSRERTRSPSSTVMSPLISPCTVPFSRQTSSTDVRLGPVSPLVLETSAMPMATALNGPHRSNTRKKSVSPIEEEQSFSHLGPANVTLVGTSKTENSPKPRARSRARPRVARRPSGPGRTNSSKPRSASGGAAAVKRIVDMGFTVRQAREALKMTDSGEGVNVNFAVDMLLREAVV